MRWLFWSWLALAACAPARGPGRNETGPNLTFTHAIAEGSGDAVDPDGPAMPRRTPAPSAAPAPSARAYDPPPDPEALRVAEQWEYELEWNHGTVNVLSVTQRVLPKPVVTARRMGRFAVELWIGKELVERVRFDFPMLALEDPASSALVPGSRSALSQGARVKTRLLVPAAARARRAVLVDRATGSETPLSWPPQPAASGD